MKFSKLSDEEVLRRADFEDSCESITAGNPKYFRKRIAEESAPNLQVVARRTPAAIPLEVPAALPKVQKAG